MISGLPDEQTVLSELGKDADIWLVLNQDEKTAIFVPDRDTDKGVIWMFLGEKDGEQFAHILTQVHPQFKGVDLVASKGKLGVVYDYAREQDRTAALITPEAALTLFNEYEDSLPRYYGLDVE
jgi:hypothetical protein